MWQAQRFEGEERDAVLAEMLAWLDEHEESIVEFQTALTRDSDGTEVFVVTYRARGFAYEPFLA